MKIAKLAGRPIGRNKPFVIAEAGVNHEGSLDRAIELVHAAAEAGADMIKFQSYKANTLASRQSPAYWDSSQEAATSQFELFQRYDSFEIEDYRALATHAERCGIAFASTPFDARFIDQLAELMPVYKIASADITNYPLLRQVASKSKPILLSTGASHLSEIEAAVRLLKQLGVHELGVLHCILEYPTAPNHAELSAIEYLSEVFPDCTIGWSDHVPPDDGCLSMHLAWLLGADILEKHFTLDKSLPGNDHYHAMDPDDLRALIKRFDTIRNMLGARAKNVMPWEENARAQARRSLTTIRAIPAGTPVQEDMLIPKRPGTGIGPEFSELIVGKAPLKDLPEDHILSWNDFLGSSDTT